MPAMTIIRAKSRPHALAPVEALVGAAMLAGAALAILSGIAAFAMFALIAGVTGKRVARR